MKRFSSPLGISLALLSGTTIYLALHHIRCLNNRYPDQHHLPSYLLTPHLQPPYTEWCLVTTRVPIPASVIIDSPKDLFVRNFYTTCTLRLKAFLARLTGYVSFPDQGLGAHASGLFVRTTISQAGEVMEYTIPSPILSLLDKLDIPMIRGGRQELAAVVIKGEAGEGDELELAYACAEHYDGAKEGLKGKSVSKWGANLHKFYMRFLLDQARGKVVKELESMAGQL
ncbi:hypothetical protein P7C73_g2810, partial [Tremellales sp. Uapishka_1]